MGANWRATVTVILTLLQIQALISVKATVGGIEGQSLDFRCEYPKNQRKSAKYFCLVVDSNCVSPTIRTDGHDQTVSMGRFSLFDNFTGAFFIVKINQLSLEDSGTYWCGVDISFSPDYISVVQLNVSRVTPSPPPHVFPKDFTVDKLHLPLYLTAVMCVAAILCVCMFTLCLLLAVKQRRSSVQHNRETSSDYETMTPGVSTEPQLYCSCSDPDCPYSPELPPPPDLCSHFNPKLSAVTLGHSEYVDLDVTGHICHYQHLDPKQIEEHVYHSLHGNISDKDGPGGSKSRFNDTVTET